MRRIPLPVKIAYSAFVAVLVPYYWMTYTPWNFLYFCDVALLVTLAGIWLESPLLISIPSVGILLPQTLWVLDFLTRLLLRRHLTGMTEYMFDAKIPLFVRGLSSFHGWLPFVLVWLLARLGYDRRAFKIQAALTVLLLAVCFTLAPAPPAPLANPNHAVNINYVHGMSDAHPQTAMAPLAWLGLLLGVTVIGFQATTHAVLCRAARPSAMAR